MLPVALPESGSGTLLNLVAYDLPVLFNRALMQINRKSKIPPCTLSIFLLRKDLSLDWSQAFIMGYVCVFKVFILCCFISFDV